MKLNKLKTTIMLESMVRKDQNRITLFLKIKRNIAHWNGYERVSIGLQIPKQLH